MSDHDDLAFEPIRGLPARLPEGERIVWQGEPRWQTVAIEVFHVRLVALWFAAFFLWSVVSGAYDGAGLAQALVQAAVLIPVAAVALGLLVGIAWLTARTTVYTMTNRRMVLRFGIALQMSVNVPFSKVTGADLKLFRSGAGDVSLQITGKSQLAYLHMWPHVRPWKLRPTQPMLRGVPHAERVAQLLGRQLAREHGQPAEAVPQAASASGGGAVAGGHLAAAE